MMMRPILLIVLMAAVGVAAQPIARQHYNPPAQAINIPPYTLGGAAVLPQDYMQPQVGTLTQPVLTSQQALNLVPLNDLQTALNNRVAGLGQSGAMQPTAQFAMPQTGVPINQFPQQQLGVGQFGQVGINQFPQQQLGQFGVGQQQIPLAGQGWTQGSPLPVGVGAQQWGGLGAGVIQQQPSPSFQPIGGIQQQQPFGLGVQQQVPFGMGVQQQQQVPFGMGVGVQQQVPLGMGMGMGGIQGGMQQPFMQQQPIMQQQPFRL